MHRRTLRINELAYVLVLFPFALAGLESAAQEKQQPGTRTVIGTTPWSPASVGDKVIYGNDDRIDVFEETSPTRLAQAASTCALVSNSDLTDNGNGTFTIALSAYSIFGLPACDGEAFANQPTAAFCTGFMVGEDVVATAGHCVDGGFDLDNFSFVFGFDMINSSTPVSVVDADQVYVGAELMSWSPGGELDHALIRVDREITAPGAAPLPLRTTGVIGNSDLVGVIGHPSGLPKKLAFGANTRVRANGAQDFFAANLDT